MNFFAHLLKVLPYIPVAVAGVEAIYKGAKTGAEKKDLALASLGLAAGLANGVAPEHHEAIKVARDTVSAAIDGIVATANATHGKDWHRAMQPAKLERK